MYSNLDPSLSSYFRLACAGQFKKISRIIYISSSILYVTWGVGRVEGLYRLVVHVCYIVVDVVRVLHFVKLRGS